MKEGDLFFALSGPNFNGNTFANAALESGAAYCVCDDKSIGEDARFIFVEDVLITLQQLAHYHRLQFTIPFIAITGSNGKTTTKELLHAVLSKKYKCYTTEGNLNNHIGVPLTLLKIKMDAEIAIVEMGANHLGEIASYCSYAAPNYGMITNCGKAHLEGFGSEENIKKGKGELYQAIIKNDGVIFLNEDFEYLKVLSGDYKKIVSYKPSSHFVPDSDSEFLEFKIGTEEDGSAVLTQLVGDFNLPNAIAALCIGQYFGVELADIVSALKDYTPSNSRSQLMNYRTNSIVMDAYNANPSSMALAIENFGKNKANEKIIYLGSMKEMGDYNDEEHNRIVTLLQKYDWKEVVLIGEEFLNTKSKYKYFKTTAEAKEYFTGQAYRNEQILIKGSRGLALEKLLV